MLETKVIHDWQPVTKMKGVKQELELFTAGKFKGAGSSGRALSETDRAYFQSIVDEANAGFVAAVKQARPGVAKEVLIDAKVYTGTQAAKLGLVDGVVSGWEDFVGLD
jgi:protease-4